MTQTFAIEMLEFLVCPETHQRLALAPPALLEQLRARQAAGQLTNRAGASFAEPIETALVREDGQFAYVVSDGIPIMLVDEALPLAHLA